MTLLGMDVNREYESETIRLTALRLTNTAIEELIVVGGGADNLPWVQVKAHVTGCRCIVSALDEATALGAALLAGLGCGILNSVADVLTIAARYTIAGSTVRRHSNLHDQYAAWYETRYEPIGIALRALSRDAHAEVSHDG